MSPTESAGTGGNAGSSGTSGLPPDQQWVLDSTRWDDVPESAYIEPLCKLVQIKPQMHGFPDITWQSVQPGVSIADVKQNQGVPSGPILELGEQGVNSPSLKVNHNYKVGTEHYTVTRWVDLESGKTLFGFRLSFDAAQTNNILACEIGSFSEANWSGFLWGPPTNWTTGEGTEVLYFHIDRLTQAVTWASPPSVDPQGGLYTRRFSMDSPSRLFAVGNGRVSYLPDYAVNHWDVLEQESASTVGAGQGDLAVWEVTDLVGNDLDFRIKGWSQSDGLQILQSGLPDRVFSVHLSSQYIAAVLKDDSNTLDWKMSFWASPRAKNPSGILPRQSPLIPISNLTGIHPTVRTGGDYAAVSLGILGSDQNGVPYVTEMFMLVTRLSDWAMWKVKSVQPTGTAIPERFAMSPTHLFVSETSSYATNPIGIDYVVRYDLDMLDSFAERIQ